LWQALAALEGMVLFKREGCKAIETPSKKQLENSLKCMKSSGPSSHAYFEGPSGNYIQIAGGPQLYAVEYCDGNGEHYRAFQNNSVVPFPDGTELVFTSGMLKMKQFEWFKASEVIEVLVTFSNCKIMPKSCNWSKLSESFEYAS
jgi:hypothetical protein